MLLADLRYAVRRLNANRSFTAVAVCTLALGIGANTAIFSIVNSLLLQPLPVKAPAALVNIYRADARQGPAILSSYPDYQDIQRHRGIFVDVLAYSLIVREAFTSDDSSAMVNGEAVSGNYFDVLGISPVLGRAFTPEEGRPSGSPVVVISHRLWRSRFNSDPSVLGKVVKLSGIPLTVIGVAPPEFRGLNASTILPADLWVPLGLPIRSGASPTADPLDRNRPWLLLKGRLAPAVSLETARAAMSALASNLERDFPTPRGSRPPRRFDLRRTSDIRMHETVDQVAIPISLATMSAVGLILLIACSNLANLLLARGADRKTEIAIRRTLGANRDRIVRLLATESFLLSAAGGVAALVVVGLGLRYVVYHPPAIGGIPILVTAAIDGRVLVFTAAVSLLSGVAFGLIPALRLSRPNIVQGLVADGVLTDGGRGLSLGKFLIVPQTAVSLVLLLVGSLLMSSYMASQRIEVGFDPEQSAMVTINLGLHGYSEEDGRLFFQRLENDARKIPGVQSAGLTDHVPFSGVNGRFFVRLEDEPVPSPIPRTWEYFGYARVGPGYFRALGIPLRRGRDFSETDSAAAPDVVVLDDAAAARFWPNGDAVGQNVFTIDRNGVRTAIRVVGVVGNTFALRSTERRQPFFYRPFAQDYSAAGGIVVSAHDPSATVDALRQTVRALNPELAIVDLKTLSNHVADQVWPARLAAITSGMFGILALGLSTLGLYGVMAYVAARRTREIGLRIALGATRAQVIGLIVRDGAAVVSIGVVIGMALALMGSRLLSAFLFGIPAADPLTFTAVPILFAAISFVACYVPVRRAARIDPMIALRHL